MSSSSPVAKDRVRRAVRGFLGDLVGKHGHRTHKQMLACKDCAARLKRYLVEAAAKPI